MSNRMTVSDLLNELQKFVYRGCGNHLVSFYGMGIHQVYEDCEDGLWCELSSKDYGPFLDELTDHYGMGKD